MDIEQLALFESVTNPLCNTFKKCKKPNNDGLCNAVTLLKLKTERKGGKRHG
jgi:hypothetical protein